MDGLFQRRFRCRLRRRTADRRRYHRAHRDGLRIYRDGNLEGSTDNLLDYLAEENTIRFHMNGDDPVGRTNGMLKCILLVYLTR